jgi:hypothetical protein
MTDPIRPQKSIFTRESAAPGFKRIGSWSGPPLRAALVHTVSRAKFVSSESRPARRRKLRVDALIRQAEKAGKVVTSITTPDGVTLRFDEPEQNSSNLSNCR